MMVMTVMMVMVKTMMMMVMMVLMLSRQLPTCVSLHRPYQLQGVKDIVLTSDIDFVSASQLEVWLPCVACAFFSKWLLPPTSYPGMAAPPPHPPYFIS